MRISVIWIICILLAELLSWCDVTDINRQQVGSVHIEELLEIIHPDLHNAGGIDAMRVFVARESVRMEGTEDVANARTRDRF